jgi:hypothetical protein
MSFLKNWLSPWLLFYVYRGSSLELKRSVGEFYHALPFSTKDKNEWSYKSNPPRRLYGVDRDFHDLQLFNSRVAVFVAAKLQTELYAINACA